ncbi:hypothetical protein [Pseudomonas sp. GV071]|uniref:hypothetical protein n=1 Tax=Pseudomonas sp. GV071 TaxID=2135754 RepID=UPI000D49907B|nr:hypothetical protein [Pseudomonas sp. GV071]PTQ69140.1 hypothetical protein C8K61_109159 [Pseudomonas sp. GV071]
MKGTFYCTKCTAENAAGAGFCFSCGQSSALTHAGITEEFVLPDEPVAYEQSRDTFAVPPPSPTRSRGFIAKHWRGGYSLGVAYWVFGTLLTLLSLGVALFLRAVIDQLSLSAAVLGTLNLLFYGFFVALSVWQIVGIVRSASAHVSRGGKQFWAALATVMVCVAILRGVVSFISDGVPVIRDAVHMITGTDSIAPYALRLMRDDTELELAGGIPIGTADAVKKILDSAPGVRIIHLNSVGGRITEGDKLARLIAERGLITYTPDTCASACALAYLAGRERYLGEKGKIGFHSASVNGERGSAALDVNASFRKALYAAGATTKFVEKVIATSPHDMWYPSPDELKQQHIITAVVDSRRFGLSGIAGWQDASVIERSILKVPVFAAMSTYDPPAYAKLKAMMIEGVKRGRSMDELHTELQAKFLDSILPAYLSRAPDQALLRYWRSQIAELRYLNKTSAGDCMSFLGLDTNAPKTDLIAKLPKELTQEDLAALTVVIQKSGENPVKAKPLSAYAKELQGVLAATTAKDRDAVKVISDPQKFAKNPAKVCSSMILLYDNILALKDPSKSAGILRGMALEEE